MTPIVAKLYKTLRWTSIGWAAWAILLVAAWYFHA
jgi:hypothetical protein